MRRALALCFLFLCLAALLGGCKSGKLFSTQPTPTPRKCAEHYWGKLPDGRPFDICNPIETQSDYARWRVTIDGKDTPMTYPVLRTRDTEDGTTVSVAEGDFVFRYSGAPTFRGIRLLEFEAGE